MDTNIFTPSWSLPQGHIDKRTKILSSPELPILRISLPIHTVCRLISLNTNWAVSWGTFDGRNKHLIPNPEMAVSGMSLSHRVGAVKVHCILSFYCARYLAEGHTLYVFIIYRWFRRGSYLCCSWWERHCGEEIGCHVNSPVRPV